MAPAANESFGSGKWHASIQSSSSAAGTAVPVMTAVADGVAAIFGVDAIVVGTMVGSTLDVDPGEGWYAAPSETATRALSSTMIFWSTILYSPVGWMGFAGISPNAQIFRCVSKGFPQGLKGAGWIAPARREPRRV